MRHATRTALAFAAFLALAAATTWPLALAPRERLPDNADALHFAWSTAWVSHQLVRNPLDAFHANIFFPDPAALAYGEPVLGEALLAWPILAATRDAALTYNLLLVLTIGLCGFFTFMLVREISGNPFAAFLAGEIFALTTANYDSAARIQIVSSEWTPLVFYFLIRLWRGRRVRDGILCGGAFGLQCLSCSYYGLFVATLLVLTVPLLAAVLPRPRIANVPWRGLAGAIAVACLLVAPVALVQYRQLHSVGAERTLRPGALVGSSYQQTLPTNWVYGTRFGRAAAYDDRHFQGFLPLLLAAAGLLCLRRRQPNDSAANTDTRRWLLYFAALGVLAYLLACGRDVSLFGGTLPGPYRLLHEFVPGYAQTRVPARFVMVVRLALAVLAASGAARLVAILARRRSAFGTTAVACLAVALPLEHVAIPLPTWTVPSGATVPDVYRFLPELPPGSALLEFPPNPIRGRRQESLWMLLATRHWRPIVNGFSSYYPLQHEFVIDSLLEEFPSVRTLRMLRTLGVTHVVFHPDMERYSESQVAAQRFARKAPRFANDLTLARSFDDRRRFASELGVLGGEQVYALTPLLPRRKEAIDSWPRVRPRTWRCESAPATADCARAYDGDLTTEFATGRTQVPQDRWRITFAEPLRLAAVSLVCGRRAAAYPRNARLFGRVGSDWLPLASWSDFDETRFLEALLARSPRASIDMAFAATEVTGIEVRIDPPDWIISPWSQPEVELVAAPGR